MDTVRPQAWKFVVFFIGAFVCMIAPVAVGIVLELGEAAAAPPCARTCSGQMGTTRPTRASPTA